MEHKIAFFEVEDWEKEFLKKELSKYSLFFNKELITIKSLEKAKDASILSTFIYSKIDKKLLENLSKLKFIATRSTGTDHIDLEVCRERNILVSNVPSYGETTVAEHTFALILALSRKLIPSIERTKKGNFSLKGLTGFELKGKTLGVVGVGHIGKRVIEIARCFKMRILAFTAHPDQTLAQRLGFKFIDFKSLLSQSDIVSLHVPLTEKTYHLINKENIRLFKRGSILINTSRGEVVETEAVLYGLDRGILAATGLDVLEGECFLKEERQLLTDQFAKECDLRTQLLNHALLRRRNVIVTPHNAFNSSEALKEILKTTILNITSFILQKPVNLV